MSAVLSLSVAVLLASGCKSATPASAESRKRSSPAGSEVRSEPRARAELRRAVDAVYPALVRIHVVMEEGDEGRMQKRRGTGSGTIISKDGYILTNHHVAGRPGAWRGRRRGGW